MNEFSVIWQLYMEMYNCHFVKILFRQKVYLPEKDSNRMTDLGHTLTNQIIIK
jgi:hypothetical protein